jgi:2-polyprenyl-6-methoxyphenol hydroxylase-like FAD-dependent oxidoreductase
MAVLTLPGDNGSWSITIVTASGDQPLKRLRHAEQWTNVIRACPLHAHWLDGTPITDVLAMSGVTDRYRRYVVGGKPVATGFLAVADAWACTSPSAGRGLTVGFKHAVLLRDVLRETRADPRTLLAVFHERTEAEIAPWYHAQVAFERYRAVQNAALRDDRVPPPPSDELSELAMSLFATMATDPELFRAALEYVGTITPLQDLFRRPAVATRVRGAMDAMRESGPVPIPGPDRAQLLALVR